MPWSELGSSVLGRRCLRLRLQPQLDGPQLHLRYLIQRDVPGEDERGEYDAAPHKETGSREEPQWSEQEWAAWRRQWHDDDSSSSREDVPWNELEVENPQVLPDEALGWLLLRRANLSAASRLSVQASVQNSFWFKDIELALRDQEEELTQADHHRQNRGPRRRTFWVEE